MVVLGRPVAGGGGPRIALFGTGTIGSAVARALRAAGTPVLARMPVAWGGPSEASDLAAIGTRLTGEAGTDLQVIWSAGRAGFSATEADAALELSSFAAVLETAERLSQRAGRASTCHLLSSAGGLFEGQRQVDDRSTPAPRRPYGLLKLRQEELLEGTPSHVRKRIWRASSVYGYVRRGHRAGLVSTLLADGLSRAVTSVTGRLGTLRDFVFAEDVGSFVASAALAGGSEERTVGLLCLGRPASFFEVQRLAEQIVGRKLFVSHGLDPANAADITFSTRSRPAGWHPSELRTGMARVFADLVSRGAGAPPEAAG